MIPILGHLSVQVRNGTVNSLGEFYYIYYSELSRIGWGWVGGFPRWAGHKFSKHSKLRIKKCRPSIKAYKWPGVGVGGRNLGMVWDPHLSFGQWGVPAASKQGASRDLSRSIPGSSARSWPYLLPIPGLGSSLLPDLLFIIIIIISVLPKLPFLLLTTAFCCFNPLLLPLLILSASSYCHYRPIHIVFYIQLWFSDEFLLQYFAFLVNCIDGIHALAVWYINTRCQSNEDMKAPVSQASLT